MSLPTSVVITGIDKPEVLDQAIEAAKTFKPMNREQMAQLLAKTKEVAVAGKYELFNVVALRFHSKASGLAGRRHSRR
jgi:hypothetical protein